MDGPLQEIQTTKRSHIPKSARDAFQSIGMKLQVLKVADSVESNKNMHPCLQSTQEIIHPARNVHYYFIIVPSSSLIFTALEMHKSGQVKD